MNIETVNTQAGAAINQLHAELVTLPERFSGDYDHVVVCHGCGAFHADRCSFLGTSLSIGFRFADGLSEACIPASGCPACRAHPRLNAEGKEDNPIYNAWRHGMTTAAYNRAAQHIGAIARER